MDLVIEAAGVVIVLIVAMVTALLAPAASRRWLISFARSFHEVAKRKNACIIACGVLALLICSLFTLTGDVPVPSVHDEFGYLLSADTFAHGRLANPTHPMWESLETFYVFHQPTYQAKFPPGQSLFLAIGQVLWHPILGVWISLALAVAATTWMLYQWLPPRWALAAAILMLFSFRLFRFWGHGYWGGAVAMLGGALLLGALPQLARRPTALPAVWFGLGAGILAISRPYEGLLLFLAALATLAVWQIQDRKNWRELLIRGAAPAAAVLLLFASWIGYYNVRVTGSVAKLPYHHHNEIYGSHTLGAIFSPITGETRSPKRQLPLPRKSDENRQRHDDIHSEQQNKTKKVVRLILFYAGAALLVPLGASLAAWDDRRGIAAMILAGVIGVAVVAQSTQGLAHYTAPIACLVFCSCGLGLRQLAKWRIGEAPVGGLFVTGFPLVLVAMFAMLLTRFAVATNANEEQLDWSQQRAYILSELGGDDTKDLILVQYNSEHDVRSEWVFNEADIDNAEVVWARDLDDEQNSKLREYFSKRKHWRLQTDVQPLRLVPIGNDAATPQATD